MTTVDTFSRLDSVFRSDDDGHNNNTVTVCTRAAVRVELQENVSKTKNRQKQKKRTEEGDCTANRVRCVDAQKRIIRIDVRRSENRVLCTPSLL